MIIHHSNVYEALAALGVDGDFKDVRTVHIDPREVVIVRVNRGGIEVDIVNDRLVLTEERKPHRLDTDDPDRGVGMKPTLGRIVHYRGSQGFHAMRAAIVTADVNSLDPRGVASGVIPALSTDQHVHLWVFTPGEAGGFTEYNVPEGQPFGDGEIPPGTWMWPPRV